LFVETSNQIQICKLPYLTKIIALGESAVDTEQFQKLLGMLPNLYHLEVSYEFLQPLLDNECMCLLLKQRITHLYIFVSLSTTLELVISTIPRLVSVFPWLKHFYFCLRKSHLFSNPLIVTVLNSLSKWNSLVSFGVVDAVLTEETLSKGIKQWVMENSTLHEDPNSFAADYTDEAFRLWL
jgi:hypothetical protein